MTENNTKNMMVTTTDLMKKYNRTRSTLAIWRQRLKMKIGIHFNRVTIDNNINEFVYTPDGLKLLEEYFEKIGSVKECKVPDCNNMCERGTDVHCREHRDYMYVVRQEKTENDGYIPDVMGTSFKKLGELLQEELG